MDTERVRPEPLAPRMGFELPALGSDPAAVRQRVEAMEKLLERSLSIQEDACRVRTGHAAENFKTVRKITMNLLRQDKSMKRSIAKKRMYAVLHEHYLAEVLGLRTLVI